jgi:hypothetical protein
LAAIVQLHPITWLHAPVRANRREITQQPRQLNDAGEGLSYRRLSSFLCD